MSDVLKAEQLLLELAQGELSARAERALLALLIGLYAGNNLTLSSYFRIGSAPWPCWGWWCSWQP